MTKLAGVLKPRGTYDLLLNEGTQLVLGGLKPTMILDVVDDANEVLVISATVPWGRHKGAKGKCVVPYSAIVEIWVTG